MFKKEHFEILISAIQLQASGLDEELACVGALAVLDKIDSLLREGRLSDACAMHQSRKAVKDLFESIMWNA